MEAEVNRIAPLSIMFGDLFQCLVRSIASEWTPDPMGSEQEYQEDIEPFLRAVLPEEAVLAREYMHLGSKLDFYVRLQGWIRRHEIAIEMKANLRSKSEFDRLKGQLQGYEPGKNQVILILCGDTEPSYIQQLRELYRDQLEDLDPSFAILTK